MNCKTKSFMTKKKAFTLIELLIVIAIIGILFIVLVSKVDFATDKAKATGVQTDFRSFQLALETVSRENSGFNTFGWDIGDLNANGKKDVYDEGDANRDGVKDTGEVWTGHKVPGETWTKVFTLVKPGTDFATVGYDSEAITKLEAAINANLDPKLHITIAIDGTITMANGAQDPWNNEYHGNYITNATIDKKDQGAIVMYSDGANGEFGSEHKIANGVVSIFIPGDNKYGKDDYAISTIYTFVNGYGEVNTTTSGFSNNQSGGQIDTNETLTPDEDTPDIDSETLVFNLLAGMYEPGAINVCKENGLEAAQNMMIMSWEDMIANEYVYIDNGYVYANFDYYDMFNGDLILPNNETITTIEEYAFCEMNLTGIAIPSSIKQISFAAFGYCLDLKEVVFEKNSQLKVVENQAFENCNIQNIVIPDSVISIGNNVFYGCKNLKNVTMGNGVMSIGDYAFAGCTGLSHITLNDKLEVMGYASFGGCTSLESIELPFTGMYKGGSPESEAYNNLFGYIFGTEYYEGGVMTRQFWQDISKWTDVCIPSSLKTVTITGNKVSSYAFCGCNFENVIIGDDVEIIETAAFFGGFDGGFTNITIGTNVKVAEAGAFMVNFENLYVNNLAGYCGIEFGYEASPTGCNLYVNNQHVVDLIIPNGVTKINDNAFRYFLINSLTIPDSVTTIGNSAFYNCENLSIVTLGKNVELIDGWAFCGCNIKTLNISSNNICINDDALSYNRELERINYNGTISQWKNVAQFGYYSIGDFIVYCTDGTIDKNGNITSYN